MNIGPVQRSSSGTRHRDGNGSVGHGSNNSWVTASDPLAHDDYITAQYLAIFLFLVDIKKLLTHSISPIIKARSLISTYDFLLSRPRGLSSTAMPRSHPVPCVG